MKDFSYTIGTLVTDHQMYKEMKKSFIEKGFGDDCEYLIVDNSAGNVSDAYDGLNFILNNASGRIVILCHQDVLLVDDGREELEKCISNLNSKDNFWAIAGNAGCSDYRVQHTWITDKFGKFRSKGLPIKVHSLDENFLVIRPESRVAFSRDIGGFHLYATDICMNADVLGWSSYVIPFHLHHYGEARTGKSFEECKQLFHMKWRRALRSRKIQTPSTYFYIAGGTAPLFYELIKMKLFRISSNIKRKFSKR